MFEDVFDVMIVLLVLVPILAFLLRWGIAVLWQETCKPMPWLDRPLAMTTGVMFTMVVFKALAMVVAETSNVVALHVALCGVACVVCWIGLKVRRLLGDGVVAGGAALAILTGLSGLWFPTVVLTDAATMANGVPFTINMPYNGNALSDPSTLTFLSAPKGGNSPHMILSFETVDGICSAAWSYHAREFRTDNWLVDSSTCPP
jgi:hypothetical protein